MNQSQGRDPRALLQHEWLQRFSQLLSPIGIQTTSGRSLFRKPLDDDPLNWKRFDCALLQCKAHSLSKSQVAPPLFYMLLDVFRFPDLRNYTATVSIDQIRFPGITYAVSGKCPTIAALKDRPSNKDVHIDRSRHLVCSLPLLGKIENFRLQVRALLCCKGGNYGRKMSWTILRLGPSPLYRRSHRKNRKSRQTWSRHNSCWIARRLHSASLCLLRKLRCHCRSLSPQ